MAVRPITYLSLCTGAAGLDLGFELAMPSALPVCYVEREAFACATLVTAMQKGLVAPAPLWSDVTTFDGRPWRGLVDGVIGGIPCQPWSHIGKRRGHEDERDLWPAVRRILIQSGAWFTFIENVSGMLSGGGAERVWHDLRRLGFHVEGGLFTAAEVGAPHERKRLFILAVANGKRPGLEGQRWYVDNRGEPGRHDADAGRPIATRGVRVALFPPGPSDDAGWDALLARTPQLEPAVRELPDGMAPRLEQLRMLGDGAVPLQVGFSFRALAATLAIRAPGATRIT